MLAVVAALATARCDGAASEADPPRDAGSGSEGDGAGGADPTAPHQVPAACPLPRVYYVARRAGSCVTLAAEGGEWHPEPLFASAPVAVRGVTCAYRWTSATNAPPDPAPVRALGTTDGVAAVCEDDRSEALGSLAEIALFDPTASAGSVGCDVCGIVDADHAWFVLPPERLDRRAFLVRMSNGKYRAFQVAPTERRAIAVALPPPPAGVTYLPGRVGVY